MRLAPLAAALLLAAPLVAQAPAGLPGAADASRVQAGTYQVDANHTQVLWTVDHMGFTPLSGAFGASGGTLELDPAKPGQAKVSVTFNVADLSVTSAPFKGHLSGADFFDVAKHPTATFTSRGVTVSGRTAKIVGDLTIKGVTKPVTLDARFFGAGTNPMNKKLNVGFVAKARIKRSEFGLGMAVPVVADEVDLMIHAAFVKG